MDIAVEVSLYPLRDEYIPAIQAFIDVLSARADLKVVTNSMSTQVSGEYAAVMDALGGQMRRTFETHGKAVFVMKVLGPFASP